MNARRRPYVRNRTTALTLGVAAFVAGSVLIWDAYEHRGRSRPFWTKFLPG